MAVYAAVTEDYHLCQSGQRKEREKMGRRGVKERVTDLLVSCMGRRVGNSYLGSCC